MKLKHSGLLSFIHSFCRFANGRQKCELLMKQWAQGLACLIGSVCIKLGCEYAAYVYCRFSLNREHVTKQDISFRNVLSISSRDLW